MNEKAYWVLNELGVWQEIVFTLNKPSEKHFGRIWIESSPEDGLRQLKELKIEYEEIKK